MDSRKRKLAPSILIALTFLVSPILSGLTLVKGEASTVREFVVTARQWAYDPPVIEVNQGDEVIIRLRSADISHGIYIEGYEIRAELILGEGRPDEVVVRFVADKPGTFVFRCSVNCGPFHPFMTGILKVNPNYRFQVASVFAVIVALATALYLVQFKR